MKSFFNPPSPEQKPDIPTEEDVDDFDIDNMDYPLPDEPSHHTTQASMPTMIQDDSFFKTWICVYPLYVDADKSFSKGRKVAKALAVKNPRAPEINAAIRMLGFNTVLELNKTHPRDYLNPGRVRVQLINERGRPSISHISTRRALLLKLAAAVSQIQGNPQIMGNLPPMYPPGMSTAEFAKLTGQPVIETFVEEPTPSIKGKEPATTGTSKKKNKKGKR